MTNKSSFNFLMMLLGFMEIKFQEGIEGCLTTGDFLVGMETDQVITLEKKNVYLQLSLGTPGRGIL